MAIVPERNRMKSKTNFYIIILFIIFIGFLAIKASGIMIFISLPSKTNQSAEQNENAHIIRIIGKIDDGENYRQLNNQDRDLIKNLLGKSYSYHVISVPALIGATDDKGGTYLINGVPSDYAYIAGQDTLEDDTLYMLYSENESIELSIPILESVDNGVDSHTSKQYKLECQGVLDRSATVMSSKPDHDQFNYVVVNETTFFKLFKVMHGVSEEVPSIYDDTLKDMVRVDDIYVYVKNLVEYDAIETMLQGAGYSVH